ncbi:MAG: cytochrome c oxidase assembly protein [Propionicimonas sp.]|uniref:cytochrome c oxidase assembly protein n=1 Tax=Propionicimonas sp. TaxID=1955623 RepID=UPI002B1ECB1D|nr:cytochrome c oxidase assembly protein [Propionicimonas sp.]MEA4943879.1 cytochrome c oxidase assembly protein [Propionicimonas sp.]
MAATTDQLPDTTVRRVPSLATTWSIWLAVGVAVAATGVVASVLAGLPALPGRPDADPFTGLVSLLGDLVARLAGLATLGWLAGRAVFLPAGTGSLPRWGGRTAQLWLVSALLMTFANPAFVYGLPLGYTLRPDAWWTFLSSTPSTLAWLISALAALAAVVVAYRPASRSAAALAWLAGTGATVFVAVTGNVSVGLDHDFATDAMGIATVCATVLAGGAVGVVAVASTAPEAIGADVHRYHRAALPLLVVAGVGYAVAAWQQLAGVPLLSVAAGVPVAAGGGLLVLLVLNWCWRQLVARREAVTPARLVASVGRDLVGLIGLAACLTAAVHLPPPRFEVPQSAQVNYLGYEVNLPATLERLAGLGRPNLLWLTLVVIAIGSYLAGMVKVHRSGGRWPVSRLLWWLGGWLLTGYLAVSGLWMYSTAVYNWHMLVHMTVNMMVPVLCVLGAPFTLAREALPPPFVRTSAGKESSLSPLNSAQTVGGTGLLDELSANRVVRVLLSPPVVWVVYVSSLFAVYFTPLFEWLMRYHWAHQLMLLYFMAAGYAFFALLVGPDRHPWPLPHLVKFALLVSVMPFHAIFAVGIMTAHTVIGENFYRTIDITWVGDLLADQNIAGQITWFTGEIPAFVAVLALVAQWFRSDSRKAVRDDQLVDAGGEDELAAYNEMLAELAERDRREQRLRPSGGDHR